MKSRSLPFRVVQQWRHQVRAVPTAIILLLIPPSIVAQQTIHGVVARLETVATIDRATVLLVGPDGMIQGATLSDSAGRFEIDVPRHGNYTLRVHRVGYEGTESASIGVAPNTSVEVRVNLTPEPAMLEAITVYGEIPQARELREFHQRRSFNRGYSFIRSDFERLNVMKMPDLLIEIPGARVRGNYRRERQVELNWRKCEAAVFVNGRESVLPFLELSDGFTMDHVYGIEIFREFSDVPAEYAAPDIRNARCGVILIWTMSVKR